MKLRTLLLLFLGLALAPAAHACTAAASICEQDDGTRFGLVRSGSAANVYVDEGADKAVGRAAAGLVADLAAAGGRGGQLITDPRHASGEVVIIGVLGQSAIIDRLVREQKLVAGDLAGQWEAFRQLVVENPLPGVKRALVIVGSDRRGAVFGTYDMSEKIGVSPWHWWADVPVARKNNVFITSGSRKDQPRVRYRGFFINDEEPAFGNWARETFGGINAKLYEKVFELTLRLKGNYLWPAMWGKAFNADDPRNMVLADEMGVIMGTSHHEPMMRAQDEWHRNTEQGVTGGAWDYTKNAEKLRAFWRGGIERMASKPGDGGYESIVTVGMRGDGDEPMTEGTATELLETIVRDQRRIIADVTGKPASETPQLWALYKEVQDYYDRGMKVPEDVLLLFADDNWGQIRRLPTSRRQREGGYGVYYHFDYVGGPRNYKWLNTNQIEKVWQQMNLAYESGADDLWIVNVGDIKPMEFPLSFFMDMAWDPEAMTVEALAAYPEAWAAKTFGKGPAREIGTLLTGYARIAASRKPELLEAQSFLLRDPPDGRPSGADFEASAAALQQLEQKARRVRSKLRADHLDAYFQLVEHPIAALSNLYQLYRTVARNQELAAAGDPRANAFADAAEAAFRRDREITAAYHQLAGGKWNHMMAQTHIGYTGWQQPESDAMPAVRRVPGATAPASGSDARKPAPTQMPIAIEAVDFTRAINDGGLRWRAIPNLGRSRGAVTALPQGRAPTSPEDNVRLDYAFRLPQAANATVSLHMVPTLDVRGAGGIKIGMSIDDGPIQILSFDLIPDQPDWTKAVIDNVHILNAISQRLSAGDHRIKIWRIDDNAVLQKIVVSSNPL